MTKIEGETAGIGIPIPKPELTGDFNITPSVDRAIPVRKMDEDSDWSLHDDAAKAFTDELTEQLKEHPELASKRARLRFIKTTFKFDDHRLARFFGITQDQVRRYDLRGRRKEEKDRFEDRFNGFFTIASILERNFHGYIDEVVDRRVSLETPNGKLSDVSIGMAMRAGYINIAVGVALYTLRHKEDTIG